MPVVDPNAPWLANAIMTLLVTALITWGSVKVATRGQRKDAAEAKQNSAAVLNEVQNSHTVPLRDDLDAKIAALTDGQDRMTVQLGQLADTQQATRDDIRETRRDIGGLRADARADREQIASLGKRVDRMSDQMTGRRQ